MTTAVATEPREERSRHARLRSAATDVAICLAAAAALSHAVAVPAHLERWTASGLFFIVLTLFQGGLAVALFRDRLDWRVLQVGLWGNVAVVVLYVVSRTAGLPFAPGIAAHGAPAAAGRSVFREVERVGSLDLFTLVVELALVIVLLGLLPARQRRRSTTALMWTGLVMWALAALGVLA